MKRKKINGAGFWQIVLKSNIGQMLGELEKMRMTIVQLAHSMKQYEATTGIKFPHKEFHAIASDMQKANMKLQTFLRKPLE